jgi:hypothetical protein
VRTLRPASPLCLPGNSLVTGVGEELFNIGLLQTIPCNVEEIEQGLQRLRWARSEAAARLAAFDADLDRRVAPAADAALALVFFELPTCARSEAAARRAALEAVFDPKVFPAVDPADLLVLPERATLNPFSVPLSA